MAHCSTVPKAQANLFLRLQRLRALAFLVAARHCGLPPSTTRRVLAAAALTSWFATRSPELGRQDV
eukprot:15451698-Alexandrium_andersonii.AAC.1